MVKSYADWKVVGGRGTADNQDLKTSGQMSGDMLLLHKLIMRPPGDLVDFLEVAT